MQIRTLGCSGSIAQGNRTTSFLVGESLLVDAGTGVGDLPLPALARIDHVLISHSHLDHILALPLLADATARLRRQAGRGPIQVHALAPTLAALREHVFNGVIWPDFITRLPQPDAPALSLHPVATGQRLRLGQLEVEVLPAEHTVPAVGYAVRALGEAPSPWWAFSGDTGPNPALWRRLAQLDVAALYIDTAFGDEEAALARASAHLCPAELALELRALAVDTRVFITHIKPGEREAVLAQVRALGLRQPVQALQAGQELSI